MHSIDKRRKLTNSHQLAYQFSMFQKLRTWIIGKSARRLMVALSIVTLVLQLASISLSLMMKNYAMLALGIGIIAFSMVSLFAIFKSE